METARPRILIVATIGDEGLHRARAYWFFRHIDASVDILSIPPKNKLISFAALRGILNLAVKSIAIEETYDLTISYGATIGLVRTFLAGILRLRSSPHLVIDIGAGLFLSARLAPLIYPLLHLLASQKAIVVCFSSTEEDLWRRTGLGVRVGQLPLTFNSSIFPLGTLEGDYVFSGGSTARDFSLLVEVMRTIGSNLIIACGPDPLTGRVDLPAVIPKNVKILRSLPLPIFLALMSRALIVVIPLHDVPFPAGQMAVIQAQAMGRAVIATRNSGTIELIRDGHNGVLVEPGRPEELGAAIQNLLSDQGKRFNMGSSARNEIGKSERATAEEFVKLCRKYFVGMDLALNGGID